MTTPAQNLFASHHQRIMKPGWMNWVSGYSVFAHYPGYVSSQSPTRCITSFSFYNLWSLLKAVVYIFLKFKKKNVIRCHCRQPHLAANFQSRNQVYHGSKSSLHYFMFVYFFIYLFCCCCCHFRCFYCKMSSYGVNLVSLIQVTTLALVAVAQFRSRARPAPAARITTSRRFKCVFQKWA